MNNDFEEAVAYIRKNPIVVLGTVDEKHTPYGAVIYVCSIGPGSFHFLTKNGTRKFFHLTANPQVSITGVNTEEGSTLQANGRATVETDPGVISTVVEKMGIIHAEHANGLPPIAQLYAGAYEVVRIELDSTRLTRFGS